MMTKQKALVMAVAMASSAGALAQLQELEVTRIDGDTDQKTQVISSEMMEQNMVSDLNDLVRNIPGVVIKSSDTRWGDTGFNIRGVADDRIAVTIDGMAQGESLQYEGGQAYGYFKGARNGLELETVKMVRVTRGADSVVSGSGALGGSVQFTTKDADDFLADSGDDMGGKISASYADASEQAMLSVAGATRMGQFEALTIVTGRQASETANHTAGADIEGGSRERPDPQDKDRSNLLLKLNYDISDSNVIGVVAERYKSEVDTNAKSFNGRWYIGRRGEDTKERQRIGIFHNWQFTTPMFDELNWTLDYQTIDFEAKTPQSVTFYDNRKTPEVELTPRIDTRSFDQTMKQLRVDFTKNIATSGMSHTLVYGLGWVDKEVDNSQVRWQDHPSRGTSTSVNQALIPNSEVTSFNVYALDSIQLSEQTRIDVGLRYDDYDYSANPNANFEDPLGSSLGDQSFDAISGALGLQQQLSSTFGLSAKIGRGFRAPTIENLYTRSGSPDNWSTAANPNLDVETATNYEVSLNGKFDAGQFELTAFFSKYQDFIEYSTRTRINEAGEVDEYSVPDNVGDAEIKGIEFSGALDLHKAMGLPEGFSTHFVAAYSEGEQDNGDPLTSVQPMSASWTMAYRAPSDSWGVEARTEYTAGKDGKDAYFTRLTGEREDREYLSRSATLVDLVAYYNITNTLTVRAGAYNLTDKEYYTWDGIRFVGRDDLRPGIGVTGNGIKRYTEPGRNFKVRIDYRF